MAVKEKKENNKNKLIEVLTKEYKYENIFLALVATLSISFGVMILNGNFEVKAGFPILGKFPDVFAWTLIAVAVLGLIVVAYPFYEPAVPELKKITWATRSEFLGDMARVFTFMILLSLMFLFFDLVIMKIVGLIW